MSLALLQTTTKSCRSKEVLSDVLAIFLSLCAQVVSFNYSHRLLGSSFLLNWLKRGLFWLTQLLLEQSGQLTVAMNAFICQQNLSLEAVSKPYPTSKKIRPPYSLTSSVLTTATCYVHKQYQIPITFHKQHGSFLLYNRSCRSNLKMSSLLQVPRNTHLFNFQALTSALARLGESWMEGDGDCWVVQLFCIEYFSTCFLDFFFSLITSLAFSYSAILACHL